MTIAKQIALISEEEYLADELKSETRHEYLGGYVYAMAGSKNVHTAIASSFLGILYMKLRGKRCQAYSSDTKVRVRLPTHTRYYYPDGMVICDSNAPDQTFQERPVVIAEVLSESTRRIDEGEKRDAYLTVPSLSAYLMIETEKPRVVMHLRTEKGFVSMFYEGLDAIIPLKAIDVELPLAELYERVDFKAAIEPSTEEPSEDQA